MNTHTATLTGTHWLNAAQLCTVKKSMIHESYISKIECGVYSSGEICLAITETSGKLYSVHLDENGNYIDQYAHLK